MQYYNETDDTCWMFTTDDITQKMIVVNSIPPGECGKAIDAIFCTKAESRKLRDFSNVKLGDARIRPFKGLKETEKVEKVRQLLDSEYSLLKAIIQ